MMNETLKVLAQRYSCNAFTDEPVKPELIDAIAEAALHSPSGTNAQPWRIVVVTDKQLIQQMEDETVTMMGQTPDYLSFYEMVNATKMKLFYNAGCMIVLPYDSKNPYAKFDCGIAAQSIAIAAQSLAVSSHIIAINQLAFTGTKAAYFKQKLQFPDDYLFGLAVLLGYSAKEKQPHQIDRKKLIYVK
ncbi:MAG: nitroreductase family protein [Erysipelotrichaceae bacterium]